MTGRRKTFDVTLLGTGCPSVHADRYGAGTLVRAGGRVLLVDVGSGVTQRLVAAGESPASIDAIFLTHLHSDHLVDLYQVIVSSWHHGRDRPHRLFGPPGTRRFLEDTMALWRDERALRIAHEKRSSIAAFDVEVAEFERDGALFEEDGARVSAVLVDHAPVAPAFGFVFEFGGCKAVLSGDTAYCPNLVRAARGADLLVHEVFVHGAMTPTGTRTAAGLAAVEAYHTLSTEVGRVAREASVRRLVLTHIVPPNADRDLLLAHARRHYDGPVVVGEDLMRIDAATGALRFGRLALAFG